MTTERRKSPRITVTASVRVKHAGVEFSASSDNLSSGGVYLITDHKLPVGTRLSLRLTIPIFTKFPIRAEGEVVRCDEQGRRGLAIRFTEISEEDCDLLGEIADPSIGNKG